MRYDPINRTLHLEKKNCTGCGYSGRPGTESTPLPCSGCKGTGRGPRGGVRGCRKCYGSGKEYDHENRRQPCSVCRGDYVGFTTENFCDNAPAEAIAALPLAVVRQYRDQSWNESYLGLGTVWSCTDYGTAWAGTDEDLVTRVASDLAKERVQATKIAVYDRDSDVAYLADSLVIVLTQTGYSVRPVYTEAADTPELIAAESSLELNYTEAHAYGMAVYNAGGNGTMAAATYRKPRHLMR